MRNEINKGLDAVSKLEPGRGSFDLYGFGNRDREGVHVGGGLSYEHNISKSMQAYIRGELGHFHDDQKRSELIYEALGGFRLRF